MLAQHPDPLVPLLGGSDAAEQGHHPRICKLTPHPRSFSGNGSGEYLPGTPSLPHQAREAGTLSALWHSFIQPCSLLPCALPHSKFGDTAVNPVWALRECKF